MRKKNLRTLLLLVITFIGALTAISNGTIKQVQALPCSFFLREYQGYYSETIKEIGDANTTRNVLLSSLGSGATLFTTDTTSWNNNILTLKFWLNEISKELGQTPCPGLYTQFFMDKLLLKIDFAIQYAIQAAISSDNIVSRDLTQYIGVSADCNPTVTTICLVNTAYAGALSSQTHTIKEKVMALGLLFTKAKLEMLEVPRLQCFPQRITVAGRIDCSGQSVNGTLTLQINNTATGKLTQVGSAQADSFFDVFFEITLPSSLGVGHYQMVGTDSGGAMASSFFDVFVSLPTSPLDPATIIPLTVLIAAVATLAVASRRVRRPL